MFTGIIEEIGVIERLEREGSNLHMTVNCDFSNELKIDQSVSHNGVCLTVVDIEDTKYTVTAIQETLERSNLVLFLLVASHWNWEIANYC